MTTGPFSVILKMMMNVRVLAAVAAAAALLSCPRNEKPGPAALRAPGWQSGETSVYHVTRNDSVLYEIRTLLRLDEEKVGLPDRPRAVPTAVVTTTVVPVEAPTFFFDSTEVVFRRDSFVAMRSHRTIETDLASFDVDATYEPGRVTIRRQTIDGTEEVTRGVRGWVLDQDMVRPVLRAVPPDPGAEFGMMVVLPVELRTRSVEVRILGTKLVVTPLDSIICREYQFDTGARAVRFWYEVSPPHRLVGFANPAENTRVLLVEYEPGRPGDMAMP